MKKKKTKKRSSYKPMLPKDALSRINLGQAFAEYDVIREYPELFVKTPALKAALNPNIGKAFYVGRRGTGKTAITYALEHFSGSTGRIFPELFSPLADMLRDLQFTNMHQQPFRSLVAAFRRAICGELLKLHFTGNGTCDLEPLLFTEFDTACEFDFDIAVLKHVQPMLNFLRDKDDKKWLEEIKKPREISNQMSHIACSVHKPATLIIDRIDESWDGSNKAIVFLIALMHACLEVSTQIPWARVMVFLRENVLERVRATDTEFARLETCVSGLEWSQEQLVEMIERRFNLPFNTRLPLDGSTWNYIFENGERACELVFGFCQAKPRDILTYCSFAIEIAQSRQHQRIMIEDIQSARKRFSDSRLKDLGDEYSENYPQIQLLLARFFGLGWRFSLSGIEAFIKKVLADNTVTTACGEWLYSYTAPELFVRLLYDIGFIGYESTKGTDYRSVGPQSTVPPAVSSATEFIIHPSYRPALDLQDVMITALEESQTFLEPGLLTELPGALRIVEYTNLLEKLNDDLVTLPCGKANASQFENIVGEILRLCFFRWLQNVQLHERDFEGCVVRDWIAANRASDGFWEMVRNRYGATQVVWECKNMEELTASCFHQIAYYLTRESGKFGVLVFRGEIKNQYYKHLKRIANTKDGFVLLITEKDLRVFIRQAIRGKIKEDHIQDKYDHLVRKLS